MCDSTNTQEQKKTGLFATKVGNIGEKKFPEIVNLFKTYLQNNEKYKEIEFVSSTSYLIRQDLIDAYNQIQSKNLGSALSLENREGLILNTALLRFPQKGAVHIFYIVSPILRENDSCLAFLGENYINSDWKTESRGIIFCQDENALIRVFIDHIDTRVLTIIERMTYDPFDRMMG